MIYLCQICVMHVHLGVAGLATVGMIAMGIYLLIDANNIGDIVSELDDKEIGEMLNAMGIGGTWYVVGYLVGTPRWRVGWLRWPC